MFNVYIAQLDDYIVHIVIWISLLIICLTTQTGGQDTAMYYYNSTLSIIIVL